MLECEIRFIQEQTIKTIFVELNDKTSLMSKRERLSVLYTAIFELNSMIKTSIIFQKEINHFRCNSNL